MVNMYTTFDAVFDNIKLIAVNQANVNGDGFDWFGGGRTIVRTVSSDPWTIVSLSTPHPLIARIRSSQQE